MKPLIIFHHPCDDGFASALAAWLVFGNDAEYCGRDHNDPINTLPSFKDRNVYILDFSFNQDVFAQIFKEAAYVTWLDHHKSSFDMWLGKEYLTDQRQQYIGVGPGYKIVLDNTKSGCILAWELFHPNKPIPDLFRYIDDNDRWVHKMTCSKAFTCAIRTHDMDFKTWKSLMIGCEDQKVIDSLIKSGTAINLSFQKMVREISQDAQPVSFIYETDMFIKKSTGLCCNANYHFSSDVGSLLANKSGTFGMTWFQKKDGTASCSLRSVGDFDVSVIAKSMGGGGHKNAAGFSTSISKLQNLFSTGPM